MALMVCKRIFVNTDLQIHVRIISPLAFDKQFYFFFSLKVRHNFRASTSAFSAIASSTLLCTLTFLPDIQRSKMQSEYMHFIDQVVDQVQEQSIVLVDQDFPDFL